MGTGGTLIPEGGMPAGGANTAGRQAGSSGFAGVAVELAQGKSAAASTEQTTRGNLAPLGNDGNRATRWSASGAETPNWWRVDLGQTYRLSRVEIDWEYARAYGYRIEVSDDNANYITVVDRSNSMDATRNQTTDVNASARYVQITVTTLPVYPITWASFWEVRVFGW
jgi:alpha-L-fucosidase